MGFYFDDIFEYNDTEQPLRKMIPGKVFIDFPVLDDYLNITSYDYLAGIMLSEFSLGGQNKWGPVLSQTSNLSDVAQILKLDRVFNWIGASAMCWKDTDPLKINLDFYIINYKNDPKLRPDSRIKNFLKLISLTQSYKNSSTTVRVHGGYRPEVLADNQTVFDANADMYYEGGRSILENARNNAGNRNRGYDGTVTVYIGKKFFIRNLLVARAEATPSLVEVCDLSGNNVQPLYYRISTTLVGTNAILSTDVDSWFIPD